MGGQRRGTEVKEQSTGVMNRITESHGESKPRQRSGPPRLCFKRHSIRILGRWQRTPKGGKTQTKRAGIGFCHHTPRTCGSGQLGRPSSVPSTTSLLSGPSLFSSSIVMFFYLNPSFIPPSTVRHPHFHSFSPPPLPPFCCLVHPSCYLLFLRFLFFSFQP